MATIVNNPGTSNDASSAGLVIGIVLAAIVVFLFLMYGLPALRGPADNDSGTNINVPERMDINVNTPQPQSY